MGYARLFADPWSTCAATRQIMTSGASAAAQGGTGPVLPCFQKAEDQGRGADPFHGTSGPLRVSDQAVRWELADQWVVAVIEAGLPADSDFNGARQDGAGYFQSTTNRSRRWSIAAAYLRPAQSRPSVPMR